MGDGEKRPSKFVSSRRIKAFFTREGDVLYLDLDGETYSGVGDFVPIPVGKLRGLRLEEIPEGVSIEPVEYMEKNIFYILRMGSLFTYEVKVNRGGVEVSVDEWFSEWRSYIGIEAYQEALLSVLKELMDSGFVSYVDLESGEEMLYVSFVVPLPGSLTVFKALKVVRRLVRELELEVTRRASILALREAKRKLRRIAERGLEESFLERVSRIFYSGVGGGEEGISKKSK